MSARPPAKAASKRAARPTRASKASAGIAEGEPAHDAKSASTLSAAAVATPGAPRPVRRPTKGERAARRDLIETALAMSRSGLSPGRSGNVSCRWDGGMLITPSGMAYDTLQPDDIAYVDHDGGTPARATGKPSRKPSSEWRFHLAIYGTRADVGGVVHTHSLNATALACAHRSIPAFHYMVAAAGGHAIPLVPYATFGTQALSDHVVGGLAAHNACLMANHGQIAVAGTATAALELAHEVETLAAQYNALLASGLTPHIIDDEEMARVLTLFKGYGQRAQESGDGP
ncbi:MAG: class II aldolase/adducin family protein [Pseudomonadota bacterium]